MCAVIEKTCSCDVLTQKSRFAIFFFIPKNSLNVFCACLYRVPGRTSNLVHYIYIFSCDGLAFKGWDSDGGHWASSNRPGEKVGKGKTAYTS